MVGILVYSTDQVLQRGLALAGMSIHRQARQKRHTNIEDFKAIFGSQPIVLAQIWEDLQTTGVSSARIDARGKYKKRSVNLKNFLRANYFLKRYPTEKEQKVRDGNTEKTVRKWVWYFVERIQALKEEKIVWPADHEWYTNFGCTVDGVHTTFHEVKHPTLSKDPKYFSHKFKGPGLSYELALHIFEPRLIWVKKSSKTKYNDRRNFVNGARQKIPDGVVAVTDRVYRGRGGDPKVSAPNKYDTEELKTFKARARMRQETFHSRIKRFDCLTDQFRHSEARHVSCFEAVCVICQYEMELVSAVFTV